MNDTIKVCRNKNFLSFEYRCVYNGEIIFIENNEEVILKINIGYIKFKSQFYALSTKIKNALKNGFRFDKKKLPEKSEKLSNIKICYY